MTIRLLDGQTRKKRALPGILTRDIEHLNNALDGHRQALNLPPTDHQEYRASAQSNLGNTYMQAGDVRQALHHFQQAI